MLNNVYTWNLDLLVFVGAIFLAAALCHWWLVRRDGAGLPKLAWGLVAGLMFVGVLTAVPAGRSEMNDRRNWLGALAPTLAAEVAEMGHESITPKTAPDDPTFLKIIAAQKRWLAANSNIADVYTFIYVPGTGWVIGVDSETDYNHNGIIDDDRETQTAVGEFYEEAIEDQQDLLAGKTIFSHEPYTDRWGTWVSATAPLKDASGKVYDALGIDYDSGLWLNTAMRSRSVPLVIASLMSLVVIVGVTATAALRREVRNRRQIEAALRASEAQLAQARQRDRSRLDELETAIDQRTSELKIAATHDKLTNLPNRAFFNDQLNAAMDRSKRDKTYKFALLFLDFDRFKVINDSLGHEYGDLLLKAIAGRLSRAVSGCTFATDKHTTIARLGGDEFCVLLGQIQSELDARAFAGELLEIFFSSYQLRDREVHSSASIGITVSMMGYERGEDMLRDADNAMYRAKFAGKGRYVVFDHQMHVDALMRLTIESDLRRAVERDELCLLYQPIVRITDGRMLGAEALVRWDHPTRGRVGPGDFIELAEETGLIQDIGRWVLNAACKQLAEWAVRYPDRPDLYVSVNVSRKELHTDYAETVRSTIERWGIEPSRLVLEITETALVREPETARTILEALRLIGCRIYLDDFGIGYSSLSCMANFALDGLKLDRSFLSDAKARRERVALVHAIITLARNLSLTFVAEGVETLDQIALLNTLECESAQGYYFSQPCSVTNIQIMLEAPLRESARDAA